MKTKEEKNQLVAELSETLKTSEVVYITDILGLDADQTSQFRRLCFKRNIKLQMVKNTLLKRAMENSGKDFSGLFPVLKGSSAIMLSDSAKAPAALIKEYRKKMVKPELKGAYVMDMVVIGDDQLEFLTNIKSKNELIADVLLALQSPANNLVNALSSKASALAGVLKTLSEKAA
ncbi:MAG: 50S ribosomal protein L10 [Bacteroidetes bacterium HGW-Bacteroidetes-6]|jgi:large subunit ribosomal protein L10|nr:MAG: 50S ribosomal protein L10 [Bacteroidetes bacterium HGW-Bacteroidetes-6]